MCLFILQYKNEALDLASFHKEVERGTKITLDFCFTLKTDKRREQKQHYALLRSQQLLRCFRHASRHSTAFKRATALRVAMFHCEA